MFGTFARLFRSRSLRSLQVRPQVESLEDRQLMSAGPMSGTHQSIGQLQYSPDGKHQAYVAYDNSKYQVFEDGKAVGGTYQSITSLQFSPDSKHLIFAGTGDGQAQLIEDGNVQGTYLYLGEVKFSPDGKHLAFVATDSNGKQEVFEDGNVVGGEHSWISSLQFSSDSQHLAFVANDYPLIRPPILVAEPLIVPIYWNSTAEVIEDGQVVGGTHSSISDLQFTPDGQHLAFVAHEGSFPIYLANESTQASSLVRPSFVYQPPSAEVIEDGQAVSATYSNIGSLQFSPDGKHMAFVATDSNGKQEVIEDGQVVGGQHTSIWFLQFSSDGKHLAFVAQDGGLRLIPFSSSFEVRLLPPILPILNLGTSQVIEDGKVICGKHQGITNLLFSPDGRHLAFVASDHGKSEVIEDGSISGVHQSISYLTFNKAGTHLAFVATDNGKSTIVEDGQTLGTAHQGISNLQFCPDGRHLASVVTDNGKAQVKVQDGVEGLPLLTYYHMMW